MKFTAGQLEVIRDKEKQSFVENVVAEVKSRCAVKMFDDEDCKIRLTEALDYAKSLGVHDNGLLRIFLYLEACHPGYASNLNIRKVLEDANDPEQRYRDIINSAINLANRK